MSATFKSNSKIFAFTLSMFLVCAILFLTACNEGFDSSTKLNVNPTTATQENAKYTALTVKSTEEIYVTWTISNDAKDSASYYTLSVLDNEKKALTTNNNLTSVTIYDTNKKSLGTATTTTQGQYNLSSVLGDSKIAGGTYYAVLKFSKDGTYNIAIMLNA